MTASNTNLTFPNVSLLSYRSRARGYVSRTGDWTGLPVRVLVQIYKIAPDLVCTLKHTYVKVRSDGTSCIKCTFGLNGTKVITVDGALVLTDGTKVDGTCCRTRGACQTKG